MLETRSPSVIFVSSPGFIEDRTARRTTKKWEIQQSPDVTALIVQPAVTTCVRRAHSFIYCDTDAANVGGLSASSLDDESYNTYYLLLVSTRAICQRCLKSFR